MNRISNPCKWFATGGSWEDQREFTHTGGTTLYHFCPGIDVHKKFDHWIPINLIFFANNKDHAIEVIESMLKMRIKCREQFEKKKGTKHSGINLDQELPELLLSKKDKWIVTEAPTNQFYQVGWSDNDTIL